MSAPINPLTDPAYAFDLVRPSFQLEVEQKVAIVLNFRRKAKPTVESIQGAGLITGPTLSEQQWKQFTANRTTSTFGNIWKHYIEYTSNAFTGCAGAVVLLLDQDQPHPVQHCDFGKVVAVHSGSHPFLPAHNLGFQVRSHPDFLGVLKRSKSMMQRSWLAFSQYFLLSLSTKERTERPKTLPLRIEIEYKYDFIWGSCSALSRNK